MQTVTTVAEVRKIVKAWKVEGLSVGFIPTMGFLHEGHESLILHSTADNDRTIVSIFVNPMQFSPAEDLEKYPRDFARDTAFCEAAGVDLLFHPSIEEIYPPGFCTLIDIAGPSRGLCGKSRPDMFRGVCTVVGKLFHIVTPDRAYFGEKDAQQLAVIRRMVRDLNLDLAIVGCPTVREEDGLAKSSRNAYLNKEERIAARVLYRALLYANERLLLGETDTETILSAMTGLIEKEPLAVIDYVDIVDAETIESVKKAERPVLVALAVFIGETRLIDNFTFPTPAV